jgi:hypothetical protein
MEIPLRQFLHLAVAAASSAASPTAQAQAYPTRATMKPAITCSDIAAQRHREGTMKTATAA